MTGISIGKVDVPHLKVWLYGVVIVIFSWELSYSSTFITNKGLYTSVMVALKETERVKLKLLIGINYRCKLCQVISNIV
jgi:hypothetical protein